ncbi:hypothetical protein OCEANICA350_10246 [Oceanicaulis sp. 350]|nr:hypothetical protein OCEANICA350_10246 [Oceanicaulis sp. 350]
MARVTGLEPATSGVTGRRSNQLSYTRSDHLRRKAASGSVCLKALPPRVKRVLPANAAFACGKITAL